VQTRSLSAPLEIIRLDGKQHNERDLLKEELQQLGKLFETSKWYI
jgi:hypothetical protein